MILYEVNLQISPSLNFEFHQWLKSHVQEMLSLRHFDSGQVYTDNENKNRFCVHYTTSTMERLNKYLSEDAAKMRQDGITRFGKNIKTTRRILVRDPS